MKDKIVDYIIDCIKDYIKLGIKEEQEKFPTTEITENYLTITNIDIRDIDDNIFNLLIDEYINYLK